MDHIQSWHLFLQLQNVSPFQFSAEKETSKDSVSDVIKERDQAVEDLQSVETAFSDLHRRYEKVKTTVEGFKKVSSHKTKPSGGRLNKKDGLTRYGNSHVKDKTS